MKDRVRRIFAKVPEGVDLILLHNNVDPHVDMSFFHATDLVEGGGFERSVAVLHRDGRIDLGVPGLEETSARRAPDATISTYQKPEERKAFIQEKARGIPRVGLNYGELITSDWLAIKEALPQAEFIDVTKPLADARAVKDATELARMKRAARIVSEVADAIPAMLRDGLKEYELAAEIVYGMQKRGATGPSFDTIVGFKEGSAEPHYAPHDVPLRKGEFVLCDFGAYYQKYASDLTRTFAWGQPTKEMRDMYETCLRAHGAALAAVKAGAKGGDVHNAAAAIIDSSPWKGRFIHSVGHSLGLAVHDGPALHPRMDWTLEENMVVTIEPGIYVPGIGGVRIEDDIVVTRSGFDLLTHAKRDEWIVS
ncbi:MAG TPA: Xaa-Pro peptidase family protein [Candidatus Thermoplasmatota archaeon]|nr:Xaa-Pro peptidase family protein [Candidatus Thermoplasmatota archaeon]